MDSIGIYAILIVPVLNEQELFTFINIRFIVAL